MRTQLKRAPVRDDRPAIRCLDLCGVIGHRTESAGHHVEEVTNWGLPQPFVRKGRRTPIAATHHHPVPKSRSSVTRGAVDVEPLLPTRHHGFVDAEGKE